MNAVVEGCDKHHEGGARDLTDKIFSVGPVPYTQHAQADVSPVPCEVSVT